MSNMYFHKSGLIIRHKNNYCSLFLIIYFFIYKLKNNKYIKF